MSSVISVVVVAYRSGEQLVRCLRSVLADAGAGIEVVVVDNGGGGAEIEHARGLTGVRVVSPGRNLGFAGGCNVGALNAKGDVLVFLNPDTVVAEGAIRRLAETVREPEIGIAMARLRLLDRPELLNSGGNVVHITGIAWAGSYGERAESVISRADIPYASGAAMAMRADVFSDVGGFIEELFMYQEDLELAWRVRLRGLRVVIDPDADVYHDYDFARHDAKRYLLERNRLVFVVTAYSLRLLLAVAPVLLVTEVAMGGVALKQGWFPEKAAGWGWIVRHVGWLAARRRATQRLRRVPDRELARYLTPVLDPGILELPPVAHAGNRVVSAYWSMARKLL